MKKLWARGVKKWSRKGMIAMIAVVAVVVPLTGFVGASATMAMSDRTVCVAPRDAVSWAQTSLRPREHADASQASSHKASFHERHGSQPGGAPALRHQSSASSPASAAETTGDDAAVSDEDGEAYAVPAPLAARVDARAKVRISIAQSQPVSPCATKTSARGEANMNGADKRTMIYWPLTKGSFHLASPFGYHIHPIFHVRMLHAGMDMAAPAMTPVHAAAAGKVVFVGSWGGGGNIVRIEHTVNGEHFFTQYLHLTTGSILVKEGDTVKAGQHIAGVGSTGNSTGSHLHFEVRPTMDTPIDPHEWLLSHHAVYLGKESC